MMGGIRVTIRNFINNIANDIDVESNLSDLKLALTGISEGQILDLARESNLNCLFDCLNSSNREQITTTCDVLKLLMSALPASELLSQYSNHLVRALGHPEKHVKEVILQQCIRAVNEDNSINKIGLDKNFLLSAIKCLCDEDVSVGARAVEFFIKFAHNKTGLKAICQPTVIRELIKDIGNNTIYATRAFEVMVEVSAESEASLRFLEEEGVLDDLMSSAQADDPLGRLATLEVCSKLALTPHGLNFLSRHDVIKKTAQHLVSYEEDPLSSLAYPGMAKFFGQIAQKFPDLLTTDHPEVLRCFFQAVDSDDPCIMVTTIEVIGLIAYSPQGKNVLHKEDEKHMRHVLQRMLEGMTKLPVEWKPRLFYALANIIHVETDFVATELASIAESWFNQLGTSGMEVVVGTAHQPFSDLRAGAFQILREMVTQRWGIVKIMSSTGLISYLCQRSEDGSLKLRYEVVKTLRDSKLSESVLDPIVFEIVDLFVKEGPHFVGGSVQVAVQEAE